MLNQSIRKNQVLKKYRPVSLLPKISKNLERCMHRQISEYFETVLSKFQCGFQEGYSTQLFITHDRKLQKNIRSGERIWCLTN